MKSQLVTKIDLFSMVVAGMSLLLVGLGGFASLLYLMTIINTGILTVLFLLGIPCLTVGMLLFEKPQKGCFLLCGLLGLITLLILEKLSEIGSADLYLWLTNLPLFPGLSKAIESELLSTLWVWDKSESTLILSHFLLSAGLYAGISLYSLIFSGLIKKLS